VVNQVIRPVTDTSDIDAQALVTHVKTKWSVSDDERERDKKKKGLDECDIRLFFCIRRKSCIREMSINFDTMR